MKAKFAFPAERKLKEAMEFYESTREGLGAEFLAEVEAATELIKSFPLAWTTLSPRTRRCRTHWFSYIKCEPMKF